MKKLIILVALLAAIGTQAQNLQDGIKMYNFKKYQSAIKILEPLAATDPKANYFLGLSYLENNEVEKASATFQKFPEDMANFSGNARVAFKKKEVAKGMQIVNELAAKAKKKEYEQLRLAADAIIYTEGGDLFLAVKWDSAAFKKGAKDEQLFISLGDALNKIPGGGGAAMDNYENVRDNFPNKSISFSRIGDTWLGTRYDLAMQNFTKAKEADSTNPLPYKSLADACQRGGQYKLALTNIKRYLQLSDKSYQDSVQYVELLYQSKNYEDAAKGAQLLLVNPKSIGSLKLELTGILGFSEAANPTGDSTDAVKNLRIYFQSQNKKDITPKAYIEFGRLWIRMNDMDSASYYYSIGLNADTAADKTETYKQLAEAFNAKKNYCKAAEWYNNLVKANPNTQPLDYYYRGFMYYKCENYATALTMFQEFEKKYPDQPAAPLWEGKTAAAIDSSATDGSAIPYFDRWLEKFGNTQGKKNDLKFVFKYYLAYYYNSKNTDLETTYKEKLRNIDPNDAFLKQLDDAKKAGNAPKSDAKKH